MSSSSLAMVVFLSGCSGGRPSGAYLRPGGGAHHPLSSLLSSSLLLPRSCLLPSLPPRRRTTLWYSMLWVPSPPKFGHHLNFQDVFEFETQRTFLLSSDLASWAPVFNCVYIRLEFYELNIFDSASLESIQQETIVCCVGGFDRAGAGLLLWME
jgi:hypothetical protein